VRWSFPSTQHWWSYNWNNASSSVPLPPCFHPPVQERPRNTGDGPTKDHKGDYGIRAPYLRENAERAGTIQSGEETTQDHIDVHQYLKGKCKENRLFSGADFQHKKKWAKAGTQKVPSEHQETFFVREWLSTGTRCLERLWNLSPGWYSKVTWIWSWAAYSRWICLSSGVRQDYIWRFLPNLIILWLGDHSCSAATKHAR